MIFQLGGMAINVRVLSKVSGIGKPSIIYTSLVSCSLQAHLAFIFGITLDLGLAGVGMVQSLLTERNKTCLERGLRRWERRISLT